MLSLPLDRGRVVTVIICGGYTTLRRYVGKCYGACGVEDAPIVTTEGSPYYGADDRCTVCGDMWCPEGVYPRPFRRGWRPEAIDRAVVMWEAACVCDTARDRDLYPIPCHHDNERTRR